MKRLVEGEFIPGCRNYIFSKGMGTQKNPQHVSGKRKEPSCRVLRLGKIAHSPLISTLGLTVFA